MDYNDARLLDSLCYDLVLGDYPRGKNRALINQINNGEPPYSEQEVSDNGIEININDLQHTRLVHDARAQMTNALIKTGNNFSAKTDWGPRNKRTLFSSIVTEEINRTMNRDIQYFERRRAKSGLLMLHGISPGTWQREDDWCPIPLGVEDVLIPSNTLLGFRNLPFFALRRSYTAIELMDLTSTPARRECGWNMDMVDRILKWIDSQTVQLRASNWPEIWAPEKIAERVKQDTGYYLGDQVPTIDTFDVYGYLDGPKPGWVRRIILDSWGEPQQSGGGYTMSRRSDRRIGPGKDQNIDDQFSKDDFLFTSGDRKVATTWQNIAAFSFADLSGVFPARYHSVRSLGWMIYATCHVSMRMRCKFWEAVFESLMQYFKVQSMDEVQRALKLELVNRGFIDDTLKPLPPNERWQVDYNLAELGLRDVTQIITQNSASWTQSQVNSADRTEKTKFQVMAELNAVTNLVSAGLNQAYHYENYEDMEIFRRFLKVNSTDPDVIATRARILKRKVPEKILVPEAWVVDHERVMGGGNKTMEMTIAQWLMENRDKFDAASQRRILRDSVIAFTDDAARAITLVPEEPEISGSVHDAQLAAGSLLQGIQMSFKDGVNHGEYAAVLIGVLSQKVTEVMNNGAVTDIKTLAGMQNLAGQTIQGADLQGNGALAHVKALAKNEEDKQQAKQLADLLGHQMNEIKAMAQRLMAMQQKAAQQNGKGQGGLDPKDAAKIAATNATAQAKIQNMTQSHAQRTAQRQIQFEQDMRQDQQEHAAELAKLDLEGAASIRRGRLTTTEEE